MREFARLRPSGVLDMATGAASRSRRPARGEDGETVNTLLITAVSTTSDILKPFRHGFAETSGFIPEISEKLLEKISISMADLQEFE